MNFDTSAELTIQVDQTINPDRDDRPSPVVLKIFKLADDRQFKREDFLNLYENPGSRLGKDLIDTISLKELAPGESRIETIALESNVKFLGVLAEFIQYDDANAILVLPITDHTANKFTINISKISLDNGKR